MVEIVNARLQMGAHPNCPDEGAGHWQHQSSLCDDPKFLDEKGTGII
jgi:hypothetical protein